MDRPLTVAEARLEHAAVQVLGHCCAGLVGHCYAGMMIGHCCAGMVGHCCAAAAATQESHPFCCSASIPTLWRWQLGQPGCVSGYAGRGQIDCAPLHILQRQQQQSQSYSPTAFL